MNQGIETGKLLEGVKGLVTKAVEGNVQLFNRYSYLAASAAKEFTTMAQGKKPPTVTEGLARIAELNLAYWMAAADHGIGLANDWASACERTFGLAAAPAAKSAPGPMEVTLSGRAGEEAVTAFQVENTTGQPVEFSFRGSPLVSQSGAELKSASIHFSPATVSLAPKQQAVVQTTIGVPRECRAGESCSLRVQAIGFPMREILVRLTILPPKEAAAVPVASKPKKSGRAKS